MRVITAPEKYDPLPRDVRCFLAGGITNCYDWQSQVIKTLRQYEKDGVDLEHLVVYNPRRESFDVNAVDESHRQIEWEFENLEECDIFSMYFCESPTSVLPICMYELGRNIVRMQERHPLSWGERIIIGVEENYIRRNDVIIQTELAMGNTWWIDLDDLLKATPSTFAREIVMAYTWAVEEY